MKIEAESPIFRCDSKAKPKRQEPQFLTCKH